MKRVRKIVRGLNWSIRLERLEDRLPLDGGLGAIIQDQPQQVHFNYLQIQSGYWSYKSSMDTTAGFSANFGQDLYFFDIALEYQTSGLTGASDNLVVETPMFEVRTNAVRDRSLPLAESNGTGYVPIANPIMISLPAPPDLIAISNPNDRPNATAIREISQLAKGLDSNEQKAIEPTMRIGEPNQPTIDSTLGVLENVANIATVPNHAMRERSPASAESSINVPLEKARSASSEPIAQTSESRANRISRDMYYGKTNVANDRQELGWTTDVLASATRQQVISESSALIAIIASNASKPSMFHNQPHKDTDADQVEPNLRLVSHVPHLEPRVEALEDTLPPVTDDSKRQSTGSVEVGTNQSTNEGMGFLHSSWGTYVLALAGLTLSLASTESGEIPSEPELLTSKKSRLFPFGKGSV